MSANSLANLAVERDVRAPGAPVKTSTEVLVAAIPSETLAAYTALVGIVLAADIGAHYGIFRWTAYGVFVAFAFLAPLAAYRHRLAAQPNTDHRTVPIPECLAAALAAAAWGLVMPGNPLSIVIQGNALVFATTGIVLAAATTLAFTTQLLGTGNSLNPPGPAQPSVVPMPAGVGAEMPNGANPPLPIQGGLGKA